MQDVRKAVLHSLPTAECSLAEVLERTRDVNDEVWLHALLSWSGPAGAGCHILRSGWRCCGR